jgi:hypothetical protein
MDEIQLGAVIKQLKKLPKETVFMYGFHEPHSYRGYYEQVAFEPLNIATAEALLMSCEAAMEGVYIGWKGGEYTYDCSSVFNIAHKGTTSPRSTYTLFLAELMGYMKVPEDLFKYEEY